MHFTVYYTLVFFSIEFDQNQLNCVYSVFHIAKCRPMSYISFRPLFDKCVWNEPVLSYFNKIRVYIETTIEINVIIFLWSDFVVVFVFILSSLHCRAYAAHKKRMSAPLLCGLMTFIDLLYFDINLKCLHVQTDTRTNRKEEKKIEKMCVCVVTQCMLYSR